MGCVSFIVRIVRHDSLYVPSCQAVDKVKNICAQFHKIRDGEYAPKQVCEQMASDVLLIARSTKLETLLCRTLLRSKKKKVNIQKWNADFVDKTKSDPKEHVHPKIWEKVKEILDA